MPMEYGCGSQIALPLQPKAPRRQFRLHCRSTVAVENQALPHRLVPHTDAVAGSFCYTNTRCLACGESPRVAILLKNPSHNGLRMPGKSDAGGPSNHGR